jgi:hypothetical protein
VELADTRCADVDAAGEVVLRHVYRRAELLQRCVLPVGVITTLSSGPHSCDYPCHDTLRSTA